MPVKIMSPMPAASSPGRRIRWSIPDGNLPLVATASNSSSEDASGPPNTVLIAAKPPARATIAPITSSSRARRAAYTPSARPIAVSGASGPRTIPNTRAKTEASTAPAASFGPAGWKLRPSAGEWPPLPGSCSAPKVRRPPIAGTRITYHHGGSP